jgi:aspartyl-tRNA(Asn)/glutamyl-tRNA(Gln) amidotransferase subunit A
MAECDVLMNASQAGEAPRIADMTTWGMLERPALTTPAALTGYPSMSLCTGLGVDGLPVAMQFIGKPFAEAMMLRVAHAYEQEHPWRAKRPIIAQ